MNKKPIIRFKNYNEDWEQRKLIDVSKMYNNLRIPVTASDRIAGNTPYYGANGIQDYVDGFTHSGEYVLLAEDGANDLLNYPVHYVNGTVWVNNHAHVISGKSGQLYNLFLVSRMKSMNIIPWLVGGGRAKLNGEVLKKIPILLPSYPEQEKIGNFFKQLDDTIALHQRKIEALEKTKKSFLQKMFPKKDETKPEIRFAGFTDDWEQRKVGELFEVTRGLVLATSKTSPIQTKDYIYPVYSSQTKNHGLMGYYTEYLFENAITWTTDGANAGTVNYREGRFYSTNVNGVLLSNRGYANKAVAEILNNIAWKHVSKVGNPKLMNNVMSEIVIKVPKIAEQKEMSNFFKQLDDTIALHQRQLEALEKMKKSFLQKMFI